VVVFVVGWACAFYFRDGFFLLFAEVYFEIEFVADFDVLHHAVVRSLWQIGLEVECALAHDLESGDPFKF
jgi:hypothetical protein